MLSLINYLLGKTMEAKLLLTNFLSDWKRFIQTWRVPILVVPFKDKYKALYKSLDEIRNECITLCIGSKKAGRSCIFT